MCRYMLRDLGRKKDGREGKGEREKIAYTGFPCPVFLKISGAM